MSEAPSVRKPAGAASSLAADAGLFHTPAVRATATRPADPAAADVTAAAAEPPTATPVTVACNTSPVVGAGRVLSVLAPIGTKTDFFLVSDRSCPKTDGLRPHH